VSVSSNILKCICISQLFLPWLVDCHSKIDRCVLCEVNADTEETAVH